MTIEIGTTNYGGFMTHSWTLKAYRRSFYLGQDAKFCQRVLGMRPRDVVNAIGSDDLRVAKTREKLAKFICNKLGLDRQVIKQYESWALCAE